MLFDASRDPAFAAGLLQVIGRARRLRDGGWTLRGWRTRVFRELAGADSAALTPSFPSAEQSNSAIIYGNRFFLKLFRRLEEGINPEIEIGRVLTERGFRGAPRLAGAIELSTPQMEITGIASLVELVPNEGDAWNLTRDSLRDFGLRGSGPLRVCGRRSRRNTHRRYGGNVLIVVLKLAQCGTPRPPRERTNTRWRG